MTDYQITLPDGTTVEAPDAYETVSMALAMQDSGMEIELFTDRDLQEQIEKELNKRQRKERLRAVRTPP